MSQTSPETREDSADESEDELVLEGQTVVNGPDLLPSVGKNEEDREE